MRELLLGVDIGTSACKVAVFNREGEVIASGNGGYQVYYPHPGWAEQNPEEWWEAVCDAIPRVLIKGNISPEEIKGIGIDGQSWSAIAVDKDGNVLTNTPIWMDTRATDICEEFNEKIGKDKIFELCGNSLQPSYTTAKIIWYQRNLPEVYAKTYKILQSNSYIAYKLTGVMTQDLSQGYGLHCFDMRTGTWNKEMCQEFGFSSELLPEIHACHEVIGEVNEKAAKESGLAEGTPVVAGGLDAACGTLGAGVIHSGETQEQGGQAGGMSICTDQYRADERLILGFHVVPDCWLLQGGTTGGGGVMRWLEREFGAYEREEGKRQGKSSLDLFNEEAAAVAPGSDGVIFLPYMSGERTPIWDPNAKGVYYGLDFSKTKGHFIRAAMEGATVIVNCSASDETIGKDSYRRDLIKGQSARLIAGYIYANAGEGESTTDLVFGGHNLIAENGSILAESKRFENQIIYTELDIKRIVGERRKNTTFTMEKEKVLPRISFPLDVCETKLTREFPKKPFVPQDEKERALRCEEILTIQAMGLKKRLLHTHANTAVVGISGGLDSTLALIVTAKAFDMIGKDKKEILAITMPCFGTTDRTYRNACKMAEQLGATLREVKIADSVSLHFQDIGHDPKDHSVTYENAQARERTQVLMDIANATNGMVIGTGDMSELALGWATYNGDHMSMYGVNASVPKTLVRHLVKYAADVTADPKLQEVLYDVLDTPVSPELLPPKDGDIAQKTEDLVGPYELHDFYLYFMLRFGYEPGKIYRLAVQTFEGVYEKETILKWLTTFCRRFFNQQFKRSCLPDGPKIGTVALSPRGDWRMPSDACAQVWMRDLEKISL